MGGSGKWAPFDGQVPGKIANTQTKPASFKQKLDFHAPVFTGIDLGTTSFGYAFMFANDPENIFIEKGKEREPTCLLLKPDKTFAALGYKATDDFCNDLDPDEQKDYYYFHQFKMQLYETKKLSRQSKLRDATGKHMNALEVFSVVYEELKKKILKQINMSKTSSFSVSSDHVGWMITIPAIWTDEARQFMREAATNAGLTKTRLVLEPEAAALYAVNQRLCLGNNFIMKKLGPGSKYIVADLGGGTIDMCVHEILDDGHLRELYRATGGHAGGSTVNEEFLQFLKNLMGSEALKIFERDFSHAFQDLQNKIEDKKCKFTNDSEAITLNLDKDLISIAERVSRKHDSFKAMISRFGNTVSYRRQGNLLKIDKSVVKKIFQPSVETIIQCLRKILAECAHDNITTLLLVGGYSASDYVRDSIQSSLPNIEIIKVEDGRLAVVKGAVMMATKQSSIIERRSRFTYGFSKAPKFIEGVHPPQFKVYRDGKAKCKGVFHKLIEAGQVVQQRQQFSREGYITYKDPKRKHRSLCIQLSRSTLKSPTYCDLEEDQCEMVGRIRMAAPPGGWPDVVNSVESLVLGETEFTMKVLIKETGEEYETTIDFL